MEKISFPGLNVDQVASFGIIPKYGQIELYMRDHSIKDSNNQRVTNITISMNVPKNDIIRTPINSNFIGTDIARVSKIPTKTSQLTNDSGFVTSTELAAKQDKLDSYSDSASVANDKLTINYKVKQEDGTYSDVPVEFQGGSKSEMIGLNVVRLGDTTITQELADKIVSEPYKYYLITQINGKDDEIFSYAGIYLNWLSLPKLKTLI